MHTQLPSRCSLAAGALFAGLLALHTPASAQESVTRDLTVEQRPIAEVETPRSDLMVSAWVDRGDKTYRLGETLTLFVKANQDAYISVIDVGTSGKVTVVFPNKYQTDNHVRAHQVVQIPGTDSGFRFRFRVGGAPGAELLKVIATTRPDPLLSRQQTVAAGPFRELQAGTGSIARDLSIEIAETPGHAFATVNEVVHILADGLAVTSPQPESHGVLSPEQMVPSGADLVRPSSSTARPENPMIEQAGLRFSVLNASRSKDKTTVTLTVGVRNEQDRGIGIIWVRPVPSIADRSGNVMRLADLHGHDHCSYGWFDASPAGCWNSHWSRYSWVQPHSESFATLVFERSLDGAGGSAIEGGVFTLAGTLQIAEGDGGEKTKTTNVSITFPAVRLVSME
jgi:hypothetical protein